MRVYRRAGTPRAMSSASRNSGTRAIVEPLEKSALRSKRRPLVEAAVAALMTGLQANSP